MSTSASPFKHLEALGGNTAEQLQGYVARLKALEAQIYELNMQKKRIYDEAKVCGFDKGTIKAILEGQAAAERFELYSNIIRQGSE